MHASFFKEKGESRKMGEVTRTVKSTGKLVVVETVKYGGRIIIGACRGVRYLFGKPFPKN